MVSVVLSCGRNGTDVGLKLPLPRDRNIESCRPAIGVQVLLILNYSRLGLESRTCLSAFALPVVWSSWLGARSIISSSSFVLPPFRCLKDFQLENYQALIWWIFQNDKFLREIATLSFTVKCQAMQVCNLWIQITNDVQNLHESDSRNSSRNSAFSRGIILFCQPFCWAAYFDKLETKDSYIS